MISQTRDGNKRTSIGHLRLAGAALVMFTAGIQIADGAESTMRVLGTRDAAKPVVEGAIANRETVSRRDSVVQRESTLRMAAVTPSVLGRQESKLVERQPASTGAQPQTATAPVPSATTAVPVIRIQSPAGGKSQPQAPTAAPVARVAETLPSAEVVRNSASRQPAVKIIANTPAAPVSPTRSPGTHEPARTSPAPSTVVHSPAAPAPAPVLPAAPAPAEPVAAPSPVVHSPSPVVHSPAPAGLAATPIEQSPNSTVETPETFDAPSARIAQMPVSIVPEPMTMVGTSPVISTEVSPAESIVAAPATYHPHSAPAPPDVEVGGDCVTDGGPEEYLISNHPDCAYGPGQSGAQFVCGVDCGLHGAPCDAGWDAAHCIPWSLFGPGEYVGPSRSEHVSSYYLRVNDLLTLAYINSRQKVGDRYRLGIGDRLLIESSVDESLRREVEIQPDGEITLPIVGEVMAAGKTVKELREDLVEVFKEAQREPQITVTPILINSAQQEIIRSVKAEIGSNGQALSLKVTPEGTIQVPGLGSVYVQGLTLDELRTELEARYAANFGAGLLISPALTQRAASFVFVVGEVKNPNRYTLEGPTTATQAIAMAGSWNVGANLHQVVVFRRDENWCLKAIKIDVRAPLYGTDPCPVNDVWLRDNDLVIVPKSKILCATDVINLYMTRGVYAAFPVSFFQDLSAGSTVVAP